MMGWFSSTRAKLLVAVLLIVALLATFPLALAFKLFGLDNMGVSARSLRGTVWWGGAEELRVGSVRLGTVDVFINPFRLLLGQARIDVARLRGREDDIAGGITLGMGTRSIDDVTGALPIGAALAPLPVSRVEFDHVSVHFSGTLCAKAEGRVRVHVPAVVPGLNLANGFTGEARCEGDAVTIPLVSQSGQERLDARIFADGRFEIMMRVRSSDPQLVAGLAASGFRPVGGEQLLRVAGHL